MEPKLKQIIEQVEQLFDEKKYQEIIVFLNDELTEHHNSAALYVWRATAYRAVGDVESSSVNVQKSIEIDPLLAIAYGTRGNIWSDKGEYDKAITDYNIAIQLDSNEATAYVNRGLTWAARKEYDKAIVDYTYAILLYPDQAVIYFNRGNAWSDKGEYDKAITDYDNAVRLDPSYTDVYVNRGNIWSDRKEYDKAIIDYTDAIRLNPNDVVAYTNRGNAWYNKGEHDKAITDYTDAIRLSPNYVAAYVNRGRIWSDREEYDKAIIDYTDAIRLAPNEDIGYYNRGRIWHNKKEYDKAITDYTDAIRLNPNELHAYFNRAGVWSDKKEYNKAIMDYEQYIELSSYINAYYKQVASAIVEELKKKVENTWYDDFDSVINKIKKLLLFESVCLTHYTSLSGARAIILNNSSFRLSEGAFLNDTSEGRELFNYLSFEITKRITDETLAELFVEMPFIGSFVADSKHNDLILWRTYGKEAQAEAKGCALTIYRKIFIESIKRKLLPEDTKESIQSQSTDSFTFYNVAYLSKNVFKIPGKTSDIEEQLNAFMIELKHKLENLNEEQRNSVVKLLNEIAYLFKSSEYQYENEVRLVVQGVGFKKIIEKDGNSPKVYIELESIIPALKKITLGPKVERANEWAAAFNYHIKDQQIGKEEKVEIVISHLPFK